MLVSGGLALWLADRVMGWPQMYLLMAALMGIGMVTLLWAPERCARARAALARRGHRRPAARLFSRPGAWWLLLLIVLYKLGDAFAGSLSTTFLIRGVGFSAGEVGIVNKTLGLAATIVGALFGGTLMVRLGLYRSLMLFGVLQAVSNLGYWILAVTPPHLWSMGATIAVENLCGGMGTAAFVALLMTLCNRSFSATQYALLSALARWAASMSARLPATWSKPGAGRPSTWARCWWRCPACCCSGACAKRSIATRPRRARRSPEPRRSDLPYSL